MGRREEREQAFCLIFSALFQPELKLSEMAKADIEEGAYFPGEYSDRIVATLSERTEEVDSVVESRTVKWKKERLSKVALAILRLSICEILFFEDVPESVSVNEAVELAKKYSTTDDASFVNGLLGTFVRSRDIKAQVANELEKEVVGDADIASVVDALFDEAEEARSDSEQAEPQPAE